MADRSMPGLRTTTTGAVQQGASGNFTTIKKRQKKGGKQARKKKSSANINLRVGTLNVGTMIRKKREVIYMIGRRKLDISRLQETK